MLFISLTMYNLSAMSKKIVLPCIQLLCLFGCCYAEAQLTTGTVVYIEPGMQSLVAKGTGIEILASGLQNAEGPLWIADSSMLLFSDTKGQVIYRLPQNGSISKFLEHSGFTGRLPYGEEPGSNGLAGGNKDVLLICEHGDRRIASYSMTGSYGKKTVADNYQGKRLNSPNDIIVKSDGSIYFTDPPYGLPRKDADPRKETIGNGVYRIDPAGMVSQLTGELTFPNGLAFSPDEKLLYISVSDSLDPHIMVYPVKQDGSIAAGKMFFDASTIPTELPKQITDGLKVDRQGNVWATGPGGLLVIDPAGKLLGRIQTGEAFTNCAWTEDGFLYITAGAFVYRIRTNTNSASAGK